MTPDPTLIEQDVQNLIGAARMYEAACRLGGKDQEFASLALDQARSAVLATIQGSAALPSEAQIEAGIQALCELYRGDGGFIGNEAAREQVMRTWNAMRATSPTALPTRGAVNVLLSSTGEAGASNNLSTPTAPDQEGEGRGN